MNIVIGFFVISMLLVIISRNLWIVPFAMAAPVILWTCTFTGAVEMYHLDNNYKNYENEKTSLSFNKEALNKLVEMGYLQNLPSHKLLTIIEDNYETACKERKLIAAALEKLNSDYKLYVWPEKNNFNEKLISDLHKAEYLNKIPKELPLAIVTSFPFDAPVHNNVLVLREICEKNAAAFNPPVKRAYEIPTPLPEKSSNN